MGFRAARLLRRGRRSKSGVRAAARFDPRISIGAYEAGQSYGQRMSVLLDAIYGASPGGDTLRSWTFFTDR